MPDTQFLELLDHIGVEPSHLHETDSDGAPKEHPNAGEPGPLTSEAFSYAVPVLARNPATGKQELVSDVRSVRILPSNEPVREGAAIDPKDPHLAVDARIIPGIRTIETINPQVVAILSDGGGYRLADPPKSSAQARAKSAKGDTSTGSQEG